MLVAVVSVREWVGPATSTLEPVHAHSGKLSILCEATNVNRIGFILIVTDKRKSISTQFYCSARRDNLIDHQEKSAVEDRIVFFLPKVDLFQK